MHLYLYHIYILHHTSILHQSVKREAISNKSTIIDTYITARQHIYQCNIMDISVQLDHHHHRYDLFVVFTISIVAVPVMNYHPIVAFEIENVFAVDDVVVDWA